MTEAKTGSAKGRGSKAKAAEKIKVEEPAAPPAAEAVAAVEATVEATVEAAPPGGLFSLEQCVEFVLRAIVQNQEALTIVRHDEEDKVRISVAVAPEDLGKVIGKQGRTINALRTVVKTAAARTNTQVVVDLEGKAV
ncbi:MAG: KH domain-containing protein [Candidatus Sericytochromatia bacterium]|nr:KH domain-containing protein [Candidatus Tanganyikabacteria bacterium]